MYLEVCGSVGSVTCLLAPLRLPKGNRHAESVVSTKQIKNIELVNFWVLFAITRPTYHRQSPPTAKLTRSQKGRKTESLCVAASLLR